jgi:hypothetical protein
MNETEIDLSARMALHAFLIEQILANQAMTASNPEENWSAFSKKLIDSIASRAPPSQIRQSSKKCMHA